MLERKFTYIPFTLQKLDFEVHSQVLFYFIQPNSWEIKTYSIWRDLVY